MKKSGPFENIWGSNVFQLSLVELGAFSFLTVKEFKFMFGLRLVNIKYITAWFSEVIVIVLNETCFNPTPTKLKKHRWARKRNCIFSPWKNVTRHGFFIFS